MKKRIICLICLTALVIDVLLAGCSKGKYSIDFSYEAQETQAYPGEYIHLTLTAVNTGGRFKVTGTAEDPLSCYLEDGQGNVIHAAGVVTAQASKTTITRGQKITCGDYIYIPEDAQAGIYNLVVFYMGASQTFENAIEIVTDTQEQETEASQATEATEEQVEGIFPFSVMIGNQIYMDFNCKASGAVIDDDQIIGYVDSCLDPNCLPTRDNESNYYLHMNQPYAIWNDPEQGEVYVIRHDGDETSWYVLSLLDS